MGNRYDTSELDGLTAWAQHAAEELRAMVRSLPSPQREAVVLRFTTRLAVREIGSVIGKGEDATEKLISRALTKLREGFNERD